MTNLIINIIGAGRVGKTLGSLFVRFAGAQIGGICNKTLGSAQQAAGFIRSGIPCAELHELPEADLTLLTTSDNMIAGVVERMCLDGMLSAGGSIVHCSGSLTSDILSPLRALGYSVAGVHPLRSFADPDLSIDGFNGTYCAIEGDHKALELIKPGLQLIGAITHEINPQAKAAYHAAGVFASNYLVTLAQHAWVCLLDAGVDKKIALQMILNLMQGTVDQMCQQSEPAHALTGPIQRGDTVTVQSHLNALRQVQQKKLYSVLGQATLPLTEHHADLIGSLRLILTQEAQIESVL